ncbi:MAG: type II toxin-antitoxin system VapC family toxin [Nakamurella sp.]
MTGLIVDSSAVVAIVAGEPGHRWLGKQLAGASSRMIAAPNYLESSMVLEGSSSAAAGVVPRTLLELKIEVMSFDPGLAERAMHSWRRFGKGRHPAALNFGDCCTYALAQEMGLPILCLGTDFAQTDLPVLRPPDS